MGFIYTLKNINWTFNFIRKGKKNKANYPTRSTYPVPEI